MKKRKQPDQGEQLKKKEYSKEKEPEKKPAYRLPVLTTEERKARIKEAKRLKQQGYSVREIGRRLGVSHTAVQKWFNK